MSLKDFLSESKQGDGSPSSSRLVMFILAITACAVLVILSIAIFKISDAKAIALIGSLPLIIAALAAFVPSSYAVNQLGKKFNPPSPPDSEQK